MYKSVKEFFDEKQPLWAMIQASTELAFMNLLAEIGYYKAWTDEDIATLKRLAKEHTESILADIKLSEQIK